MTIIELSEITDTNNKSVFVAINVSPPLEKADEVIKFLKDKGCKIKKSLDSNTHISSKGIAPFGSGNFGVTNQSLEEVKKMCIEFKMDNKHIIIIEK